MARRHLLIGSGPGAVAAAEAIRSRDDDAEIVMVGADPHGYYSRPGLAYYLSKELPEKALVPFTPQDFARLHVRLLLERAVRIDPVAHRVTLEGGRDLPYDRLLIATGSRSIPLKAPGAELDGVVSLDDLDDARDLISRCRRAKAAVVVGGGITALEIVEGLHARGVQVHYFMRKGRYWGNVLDPYESQVVEEGLRASGVHIHYSTELAGILGAGGRVAAVETQDGRRVPCEIVGAAVGVLPQKALAEEAGLECGRGVLVDEHLRSSDDDIFAAGDVAEVHDARIGRRIYEVLWSSAVAKGRIAGLNMATEPVHTYDKGVSLNVTRLAGLKTTIMGAVGGGEDADLNGIARGDSETWRQLGDASVVESQSGDTRIRLAITESTIAGAVVMGDQAPSFRLHELIEARADVSGVVPHLQKPAAPVAELIGSFWHDWKSQRV